MAEYYNQRPVTVPERVNPGIPTVEVREVRVLSEFDRLRETLLTDDAEEGWASELRRYLNTMQRDVTKETDLVEWWQVSYFPSGYCCKAHLPTCLRTTHSYSRRLHVSHSMSFLPRLRLYHASDYSPAPNRLRLTVGLRWVPLSLRKL